MVLKGHSVAARGGGSELIRQRDAGWVSLARQSVSRVVVAFAAYYVRCSNARRASGRQTLVSDHNIRNACVC